MILELILASPVLLCGGVVMKRAAPRITGGLRVAAEKLSVFSLPGSSDTELFSGVPKPSGILAGMICTRLLSEDFRPADNKASFKGFSVSWEDAKPKGTGNTRFSGHPRLKEAIRLSENTFSELQYRMEAYPSLNRQVNVAMEKLLPTKRQITVEGFDVEFSVEEKERLLEALGKALVLHEERLAAQRAADNQMKAVAAIEEFFKPVSIKAVVEVKPKSEETPTLDELLGPVALTYKEK